LGGTLALSGSGSINNSPNINIYNGATFDVSGRTGGSLALGSTQTLGGVGTVNGSISDVAGSTVAPGRINNVGQLTINNNLTLAGGDTINYNASGSTGDLLSVGGTLTLPSAALKTTIIFVPTGIVTPGTFTVAQATAGLAGGNAANLTLSTTSRAVIGNPVVDTVNKQVKFDVTAGNASLIWAGNSSASAAWDIKTSNFWTNGGSADVFWPSDAVTFNDAAATSRTVTIASGVNVAPAAITIDGTGSYTFTGSGSITGSTGINLAPTYTGTLTVSNTNTYYGDTVVAGGTLLVNGNLGMNTNVKVTGGTYKLGVDNTASGDNSTIPGATASLDVSDGNATYINGGTLDLNNHVCNNNTGYEIFYVQGAGVGGNGAIVNNSGTAQFNSLRYVSLTGNTTIGGTSRWDLRNDQFGSNYNVTLAGNGYTLAKTGTNNIFLINIGYTNLSGVTVNQGELTIQADNGALPTVLGSASILAPITVNTGGQLGTWGATKINNDISLAGGGIGATQSDTNAASTFGGNVTLSNGGGYLYNVNSTYTCTFSGAIGGAGDLTKPATLVTANSSAANTNGGTIVFSGTAPNTYVGTTYVYAGTLLLNKTSGVNAIPGNLTIDSNAGGYVPLGASNQIADSAILSFTGASGTGWFDLKGFNETVAGISDANGFGVVEQYYYGVTTPSTFTVNGSGNYTFNGRIANSMSTTNGTAALNFVKDGIGTQDLGGVNTYTGTTTISNGILELTATGQIATASAITTAATTATFQVNGGTHTVGTISGIGNTNLLAGTNLTATSVTQGTLTIGAGATLTIAAIPGGPTAGPGSISAVPEPATWVMLLLAGLGLGIYRRRNR
jgi:fibronectin-binding autotransporter adhesin